MRGGIRREQGGGKGQGRGRRRGRGRGSVREKKERNTWRGRTCTKKKTPNLCNEIRAIIVDHVILREAGLRVQPNLRRYTVALIVRTFRQEHK